jgi:hypothetical protein
MASPASAVTTVVSCPAGHVTGSGTVTPPVSPTNTMKNVVTSTGTFTGCTGQETSGTVTSTTTSVSAGTCASLGSPSPKGTITATGTFTVHWGDGSVSSGTMKTKSTGPTGAPGTTIVIQKITSGKFFKAGHITKTKVTLMLVPGAGQNCTTVPISTFTFSNTTPANTTQT